MENMMSHYEDLARQGIAAFNADDWDGVRALGARDCVYDETGTGRHLTDLDEVIEALVGWKAALPDCTGEVLRVVGDGDIIAMEIRWTGTQTGPMSMGATVLPPSGRRIDVLGTMWQRWQGDQMIEERNHIDMLTMLAQLGALPAPAPA